MIKVWSKAEICGSLLSSCGGKSELQKLKAYDFDLKANILWGFKNKKESVSGRSLSFQLDI